MCVSFGTILLVSGCSDWPDTRLSASSKHIWRLQIPADFLGTSVQADRHCPLPVYVRQIISSRRQGSPWHVWMGPLSWTQLGRGMLWLY